MHPRDLAGRLSASALLLLLLAAPAGAQLSSDPIFPEPGRLAISIGSNGAVLLPGTFRLVGGHAEGAPIASTDADLPDTTADDDLLDLRLRVRPGLVWTTRGFFAVYRVGVDADLTWTPMGGDAPEGLDFDPVYADRDATPVPRLTQAYALAGGEHLLLKAGLVRSAFGLGLVANPGEDAHPGSVRQSPFGFARSVDRNLRGLMTVFPFGLGDEAAQARSGGPAPPLTLAVAADAVIEDDTADWYEGDRAWQVLGGLFARRDWFSAGAGAVFRSQTHHEGGTTEVTLGLFTARAELLEAAPGSEGTDSVGTGLWAETELAGYTGETTLSQSVIQPEPVDILSAGAVVRLGGDHHWAEGVGVEGVLEGGFASGDDNPVDREAHTFAFDREYRVGLLMFDQLQRLSSAVTAHDLADPTFRGEPSRGFDSVATAGAVQNALYLNPRVAVTPLSGFTLLAGYLYAVSEEPYADTLRSALAGGAAVGPRGARDARTLGHEIDVGAEYALQLQPVGRVRGRVEAAWLRPGDVYDTADGEAADDLWGAWFVGEVQW